MTKEQERFYRPPFAYTELEPKTNVLERSIKKKPLEEREKTSMEYYKRLVIRGKIV